MSNSNNASGEDGLEGVAAKRFKPNSNSLSSSSCNGSQNKDFEQLPSCAGCGKPIRERYLMNVLGGVFHQNCLVCSCCGRQFSQSLYYKDGLLLCKMDYLRKFGPSGNCSACMGSIRADEYVMRAPNQIYHIRCFECSYCGKRMTPGDRYHLRNEKIVCKEDYDTAVYTSKVSKFFPNYRHPSASSSPEF